MPNLEEDLAKYEEELFTKKDLKAGLKLLGELSGLVTIGGIAFTAAVSWMPALGVPVSIGMAKIICQTAVTSYARLNTEERKAVRSVVRFLRGGFLVRKSFFR